MLLIWGRQDPLFFLPSLQLSFISSESVTPPGFYAAEICTANGVNVQANPANSSLEAVEWVSQLTIRNVFVQPPPIRPTSLITAHLSSGIGGIDL